MIECRRGLFVGRVALAELYGAVRAVDAEIAVARRKGRALARRRRDLDQAFVLGGKRPAGKAVGGEVMPRPHAEIRAVTADGPFAALIVDTDIERIHR
jgi:hypothetical protein